ncbi:hypothetical protein [Nostoc sp.]|uniref:hypothetical protein n=1 Tax=Nostoc sp. TaxID=1180 RepID=UPI002FF45826
MMLRERASYGRRWRNHHFMDSSHTLVKFTSFVTQQPDNLFEGSWAKRLAVSGLADACHPFRYDNSCFLV